eukprot:2962177-Pyramimonas_sp.AAC.1
MQDMRCQLTGVPLDQDTVLFTVRTKGLIVGIESDTCERGESSLLAGQSLIVNTSRGMSHFPTLFVVFGPL